MIPNTLWQTWKTHNIPQQLREYCDSWGKTNHQLINVLMTDDECSEFILKNFGPKVHGLYIALPLPVMRADFWRLAILYINGGYYSDLDVKCKVPLAELIEGQPEAVFMVDGDNVVNYFIGAKPGNPAIKKALDQMLMEASEINNKNVIDYGMHHLHIAVRDYYNVEYLNYKNTDKVVFLNQQELEKEDRLLHGAVSLKGQMLEYSSWRNDEKIMNEKRAKSSDILFFTTFNKSGYHLYGKEWVSSFIKIANFYNKFKAHIYYEGFKPEEKHPNIKWIQYDKAIPSHSRWKDDYLTRNNHSEYVKTMTIRFSHKAFVIQHALSKNKNDYLIWLDGDCVFKEADYQDFPANLLDKKFLACQVEENHDLNHVESGILIFSGTHPDKNTFVKEFKKWYKVDNILPMGQPYDGFLIYKTLLTTGLDYVNLNTEYGKGGIQSDPNLTFCHPEIKEKFVHNIGWTGKSQYSNWQSILRSDPVYQSMEKILFGGGSEFNIKQRERAGSKMSKLKQLRNNDRGES